MLAVTVAFGNVGVILLGNSSLHLWVKEHEVAIGLPANFHSALICKALHPLYARLGSLVLMLETCNFISHRVELLQLILETLLLSLKLLFLNHLLAWFLRFTRLHVSFRAA